MECRLLRVSDDATNILLDWSGAQEPQSGFLDGVEGWVGGSGVPVVVSKVFSQDSSAAFCGADHHRGRGCGGDLQGFLPGRRVWSRTVKRPASCSCAAWRGLVTLFSDVKKHMKSLRNLDIISTSPLYLQTLALVASVSRGFEEFHDFLRAVGSDPEVHVMISSSSSGGGGGGFFRRNLRHLRSYGRPCAHAATSGKSSDQFIDKLGTI